MVLTMFAGVAEFERSLIKHRTDEGRQAAKRRGVSFGRPQKLRPDQKTLALSLVRKAGPSAKSPGPSTSTPPPSTAASTRPKPPIRPYDSTPYRSDARAKIGGSRRPLTGGIPAHVAYAAKRVSAMQERCPVMLVILGGWCWWQDLTNNAVRRATPSFAALWRSSLHALSMHLRRAERSDRRTLPRVCRDPRCPGRAAGGDPDRPLQAGGRVSLVHDLSAASANREAQRRVPTLRFGRRA